MTPSMPSDMMPPPGSPPKSAAPSTPPNDGAMNPSTFECPGCGMKLKADMADEEAAEGGMEDSAAAGM